MKKNRRTFLFDTDRVSAQWLGFTPLQPGSSSFNPLEKFSNGKKVREEGNVLEKAREKHWPLALLDASRGGLGRGVTGFTLMEIVVGVSILVLILVAAFIFQNDVLRLFSYTTSDITVQEQARKAFRQFTAEARSISPSSTGAYPLITVTGTTFTFFSDIDSDGMREQVRYFRDGSALKKGVIKPAGNPLVYNPANEVITVLISKVTNDPGTPVFSYYDENYDGTTAALADPVSVIQVRLVKVALVLDEDPNRPPGPLTVTSQVSLRNLKSNL